MLNKKVSLVILASLLLFTVVALEVKKTEFVIKTEPYNNISVSVIDSESKEEVELFEGRARKFGEYRFTYYGTISKVNLKISIINNETGNAIKEEEMGPYALGLPEVSIDFYLGNQEVSGTEEVNDATNDVTDGDGAQENSVTGNAILEHVSFSKTYYYIGAGVLIAVAVLFILRKKLTASLVADKSPTEPSPSKVISKPAKPSKVEVPLEKIGKSEDQSIGETEKRIRDLQKQLDQIRGEEKVLRLQKQLDQEKQLLGRMKNENNPDLNPNNQDNNQQKLN